MDEKLLKNLIKKEKSISTRLQSIRMPRDLNLGGTKVKKLYTPNLHVVRDKEKSKEFIKKNEPKNKQRFKEDRNKHNNNRQQKFVQSSGVFSEGVGGDATRQRIRRSFRENEERTSMPVPTIRKSDWDVNKKTEDDVLDDIMGSDEEFEDSKLGTEPITWNEQDFKPPPAPKLSIKTEEGPAIEISKLSSFKMPDASEYKQEFHSDENPSLSIWNLPDSFAGKGLSDDPKITKLFDYSLKDMLEGQIGKFIVRKSGRIQVQIGRIIYDLDTSECTSHMEEIVNFSDDANGVDATVLGEISNSYILNPDWESLLKQQ